MNSPCIRIITVTFSFTLRQSDWIHLPGRPPKTKKANWQGKDACFPIELREKTETLNSVAPV
jgi:hypothetical protein